MTSRELIIYTSGGTEIKFGSEERLEEKATFIHDILKLEREFYENGTEVLEYIDLRFKRSASCEDKGIKG